MRRLVEIKQVVTIGTVIVVKAAMLGENNLVVETALLCSELWQPR